MATVIGIVVLVVGLLASIALHELGHMLPAKKFGVRVSEYFVGFGPTLWSRRGKETEYGLKAIPLGGYVRMVGMIPPADRVKPVRGRGWAARLIADAREAAVEEIQPGEDARAFYHLTWWRKVIVMAGGPLVNLALAVIIFTVVLSTVGLPSQTLTVDEVSACTPTVAGTECGPGDPASPAAEAGVEAGDTMVAFDGIVVSDWEEMNELIAANAGRPVALELDRDGAPVTLTTTLGERTRAATDANGRPVLDEAGEPVLETVGFLGVVPRTVIEPQPLTAGAVLTGDYLARTVEVVAALPQHIYHVSRAALGLEERSADGIMGVVGVGRIAGEISGAQIEGYGFAQKMGDMLMLLGALNLALFVFNMIPLVPLDGGHVASALWQAIKNGAARVRGAAKPRPVDVARMMPVAYGMFGVLLLVGLVLIIADIVAPVTI